MVLISRNLAQLQLLEGGASSTIQGQRLSWRLVNSDAECKGFEGLLRLPRPDIRQ